MSVTRAVLFGLLLALSVAAASARVVPLIDATRHAMPSWFRPCSPNESIRWIGGRRYQGPSLGRHVDDGRIAELLVNDGADVQAANRYGVVPTVAGVNGRAAMVERLLAAVADPTMTMPEGDSALMTAARSGRQAVVEAFIAGGANVDAQGELEGADSAEWAAANDNVPAVQALAHVGADVQARTSQADADGQQSGPAGPAQRRRDGAGGLTAPPLRGSGRAADTVQVLLNPGRR